MSGERFYKLNVWRKRRSEALARDNHRCVVAGCPMPAVVVDHIQTRPKGVETLTPYDDLWNLRSLCRMHDNKVKEGRDGVRKNSGELHAVGANADGWPVDPNHPWNRRERE